MGLIANAVEQGVQAVQHLARSLPPRPPGGVDLVGGGAGPAGVGAGLEAVRQGLIVEVLEQGRFGGAIRHYPRAKIVMSRGFRLPGQPRVPGGTLSKEELIQVFEDAVAAANLRIREEERVESVTRGPAGTFDVVTSSGEVAAAAVLLAVGRRGSPRRLEVPGEELEKVAYRLLEPERYEHEHVLVVGGGDSAVEAACALGEVLGCRVTLSYRSRAITRPRQANQERLNEAVEAGRVTLLLGSAVDHVGPDRVGLNHLGEAIVLPNDRVFIFAGGVMPSAFLASAGVRMNRHFGKRIEDVG
ncbi:MAG: NAD(P)-binding domain-containing protein [Proteobacteria bacterium]|nr:NAD(P)-binding domain-containing protein [Pseudomonadota bacterium]